MSFNNILKAIPTSTNKELNDKLAEFAEFIDIYENAESNKIIISCLKEKEFLITHNQQVDPIIEIIFTHKSQEN